MAAVASIGVAVPDHLIRQNEAREMAQRMIEGKADIPESFFSVFENSGVRARYSVVPLSWFYEQRPFVEKNALYIEMAQTLSIKAIERCLNPVGLSPEDIDHLMVISTTGLANPSLDALLINRLGMRRDVMRTPIWGLGCGGGVAGLSRAAELVAGRPSARILVVTVELCSLTFIRSDLSRKNIIAMALFGDGAAAALVTGADHTPVGPIIKSHTSLTWPDSLGLMGWDFVDEGFKVVLSKAIPLLVKNQTLPLVKKFLADQGLPLEAIQAYILHPGGPRVIDAYRDALGLDERLVATTRAVLRDYGNMSSPTALFVLRQFLDRPPRPMEYGLAAALGPGFTAEMVLLQWPG